MFLRNKSPVQKIFNRLPKTAHGEATGVISLADFRTNGLNQRHRDQIKINVLSTWAINCAHNEKYGIKSNQEEAFFRKIVDQNEFTFDDFELNENSCLQTITIDILRELSKRNLFVEYEAPYSNLPVGLTQFFEVLDGGMNLQDALVYFQMTICRRIETYYIFVEAKNEIPIKNLRGEQFDFFLGYVLGMSMSFLVAAGGDLVSDETQTLNISVLKSQVGTKPDEHYMRLVKERFRNPNFQKGQAAGKTDTYSFLNGFGFAEEFVSGLTSLEN